MVLESFVNPLKAVKKPWHMLFFGGLYALVAVFLSIWIFKQYSSLVMVFLTVIATVPLMYNTMKREEKIDVTLKTEERRLGEHWHVLEYLLYMFIGFVLMYSILFVVLPSGIVENLFSTQMETIAAINSRATGLFTGQIVGSANVFGQIFFNNLRVLMFCLFFSFFYGAGAIFILTWNASVISAAIGDFVRVRLADFAASIGAPTFAQYFGFFSLGLLRYFIHGIPEIAAYFVGGLAGGIVSVAMINHDIETDKFKDIMMDALDLTLLAVGILVIAGLLEVFVTPAFF